MADFFGTVIVSHWGWVYLVTVLLLLWTASRYGVIWCLMVIMVGVWAVARLDPTTSVAYSQALAAGPVPSLQTYLLNPPGRFSPGGAVIVLGLAFGAFMLPIVTANTMYTIASKALVDARKRFSMRDTSFFILLDEVFEGPARLYRCGIRMLIIPAVWITAVTCLWMALVGLGEHGYVLPFSWFGMGDITVPRYLPLWDWKYFFAPMAIFVVLVQYHSNLYDYGGLMFEIPWRYRKRLRWLVLIGLACFVPAGVSLFLMGYYLIILFSSHAGLTNAAEDFRQATEDLIDIDSAGCPGTGQGKEIPNLSGSLLFAVSKIKDLIIINHKRIVTLDEEGFLHQWLGAVVEKQQFLSPGEGLGLVYSPENGDIIFIGKNSINIVYSWKEAEAMNLVVTEKAIKTFCLNPFGTILAYTIGGQNTVYGVVVDSRQSQVLLATDKEPLVMAYSLDGAELAVGYEDGSIDIIDMSKRQSLRTLVMRDMDPGAVLAIAPAPRGNWVAIYKNGCQACWDWMGDLSSRNKDGRNFNCLGVSPTKGTVALGAEDGSLTVASADLRRVLAEAQLSRGPLVALKFYNDVIFCASRSGEIRRFE